MSRQCAAHRSGLIMAVTERRHYGIACGKVRENESGWRCSLQAGHPGKCE